MCNKATTSEWHTLAQLGRSSDGLISLDSPDLQEPTILRSLANVPSVSVHTSHSGCHAVVLDVWGTAFLFGRNASSCLGVSSDTHPIISEQSPRALRPVHIGAASDVKFISAACGRSNTLLITDEGEVYSAGNNTVGQVPFTLLLPMFSFPLG